MTPCPHPMCSAPDGHVCHRVTCPSGQFAKIPSRPPVELPGRDIVADVPAPIPTPAPMQTAKPARQSRTIQAAAVAAVATLASAALHFFGIDVPHEVVFEVLTHVVTLVGLAVAIVGRLRATDRIA